MTTRTIMWFRRDLRLGDHPALLAAGADGAEVVPVFVVDPTFAASGSPRLAFLHDCLSALDASIRETTGVDLVIRNGDPTAVIPALAEEVGAGSVVVSRDYSPYGRERDAAVKDALAGGGRRLRGVGSPYAVDPGTVRKGDGDPYSVFTPFSKVWRRTGWEQPFDEPGGDVRWVGASASGIDSEPLPPRPDPGCAVPEAGERAALGRWTEFRDERLAAYDGQRDTPSITGTSQLSPDLKWGTVHPRTLLADLDASGDGPRGHTVFSSELAWRDFYADVLFQKPHTAWENLNTKYDDIELALHGEMKPVESASRALDGEALLFGLFGDGANDIIGLVVFYFDNRNIKSGQQFFDIGNGQSDILRLLFPVGLVLFVHVMAKGRPRQVKAYRNMSRLLFLQHIP